METDKDLFETTRQRMGYNAILAALMRRMLIEGRQSWSGIDADGWMVLDSAICLTDAEVAAVNHVMTDASLPIP